MKYICRNLESFCLKPFLGKQFLFQFVLAGIDFKMNIV